ncbi:MAG: methyltransferase domain-containing protein [Treponema sp.]|nr:methyltransferase domain-containing protein [Treponema sp.]
MQLWYASVNFGLERIVAKILKTFGAGDISPLEGALLFRCRDEPNSKCINNLFMVLDDFSSANILDAARHIAEKIPSLRGTEIGGRTFRIVVMDCGKLRAIPPDLMGRIEKEVSRQTGLKPNRSKPDVEVWLNRRNDNSVYFMLRLRKHAAFDKALNQGELRPDIVAAMIHLANVGGDSLAVDPFGGSGAIAAMLVENGLCRKIHSGDMDSDCVALQKRRLTKAKNCTVQKWDGLKLPLETGTVDAVITDPPWGHFRQIRAEDFYPRFIAEAARILRPAGSLVFLASLPEIILPALESQGFSREHFPLKINGKDCFLFCAAKGKM